MYNINFYDAIHIHQIRMGFCVCTYICTYICDCNNLLLNLINILLQMFMVYYRGGASCFKVGVLNLFLGQLFMEKNYIPMG